MFVWSVVYISLIKASFPSKLNKTKLSIDRILLNVIMLLGQLTVLTRGAAWAKPDRTRTTYRAGRRTVQSAVQSASSTQTVPALRIRIPDSIVYWPPGLQPRSILFQTTASCSTICRGATRASVRVSIVMRSVLTGWYLLHRLLSGSNSPHG